MGLLCFDSCDGRAVVGIFLSRQLRGQRAQPARHAAGGSQRSGRRRLRGRHGREGIVDQLTIRRHAHIPDFAILSVEQSLYVAQHRVRSGAAGAVEPPLHDDVRLPNPALHHEDAVVLRSDRRRGVGFFVVLHYNNRCGAHMEVPCPDLCSAYNSGPTAAIPRALYRRHGHAWALRHASAQRQSSADDLLLRPGDGASCRGIPHRRHTPARDETLAGGVGAGSGRRCACLGRQPAVALQHL